jgi:L-rhamnose mutarotase
MQRFGCVVQLKEERAAEYKKHHDEIWPEHQANMEKAGITKFVIYRYHNLLFYYMELRDGITKEDVNKVIQASETSRRWESFMHDFQAPLPESGENDWWVPMEEMWSLEK